MMVSVELGEMEEIARRYAKDNNLSQFLRDLIKDYHNRKTQKNTTQKQEKIIFMIKNISYLTIGFTFLLIAFSTLTGVILAVNTILLITSGLLLFLYTTISIYYKKNEVKEKWI